MTNSINRREAIFGLAVGTSSLFAPAVLARLNDAMVDAMADETVLHAMNALGLKPGSSTPQAFSALIAREIGVEPKRLSDAAMKFLTAQDFPGNVRQLENLCHWLTVDRKSVV